MWDFTHTCNPTNLPLTCESLLLCGLQDLSMGHEQVLLTPPCLMDFFLHWCIIHGTPCVKPVCLLIYPWEPHTSPSPLSSTIENILC